MPNRSRYSPDFKAKVALESLRGETTQAALCRRYNISADRLSRWRKKLVEGASRLFADGKGCDPSLERITQLEQLVGKLTLELEVSKKLLSTGSSPANRRRSL